VELCEAADATALIPLLRCSGPVILVDAYVGADAPGVVRELKVEAIESAAPAPVSSHGLSVRQAIDLARVLDPAGLSPSLRIVGISIPPPRGPGTRLSTLVAQAVRRAAEVVERVLQDPGPQEREGRS
jgi:hydrogenase maturation protease